jgi:hypothetical protein
MTASLRDTIQQLAAEFASGVLGAIRGSSLEDILSQAAGSGSGGPVRRGPGRPRKSIAMPAEVGFGKPSSSRRKGGRLGRRSAKDLARVVDQITDLLSRNPKGLRAEQIRAQLGLSAKEMPRPIAKALASKRISKVGQKRATTYSVAGGGGAKTAAAAPPRGRTKAAGKTPGARKRRQKSPKGRRPAENAVAQASA